MSRKSRVFFNTAVSAIFALIIAAFVLAISHKNEHQFDLTKNQRHTLSEQSKSLVRGLKQPVKFYAFTGLGWGKEDTEKLLRRYQLENQEMFEYQMADLTHNPQLAKELGVSQPGQGVLELKSEGEGKPRRERCSLDENGITNALMKLTRTETRKLVFLSGHGERDLNGTDEPGLSQLKNDLLQEGFDCQELPLAKDLAIPEDAYGVVVAAPTVDPFEKEQEILETFLEQGGHMVLLLELDTSPYYLELARKWGIDTPPEAIIDETSTQLRAEPVYALGLPVPGHAITKGFLINTFFRLCRPLQKNQEPTAEKLSSLMQTEVNAFTVPLEKVVGQTELRFDPNDVNPRSMVLAMAGEWEVAAPAPEASPTPEATPSPEEAEESEGAEDKEEEKPRKKTRLVVVGDVDGFTNGFRKMAGNRDFALNVVNWIAEAEDQITLRAGEDEAKPMILEPSQFNWIFFVSMFLIPIMVGTFGVSTAWSRRRSS